MEAKYQETVASIKFAIVFLEVNEDGKIVEFEETEPEPKTEEEQDEVEEPVIEAPTAPAGGWDGWKKLLLLDLDLGDDFILPEPITTEGYVPTPPKAKLDKVSVKGVTKIAFNEPVFELKNLTTKKIKVPRNLRASAGKFEFEFDEYPFLEVKVEPGENSDPSKLEFTFTADFTDS